MKGAQFCRECGCRFPPRIGEVATPNTANELLPGLQLVMDHLAKEYLTSKPSADVLDGLEKMIGKTLKVKNAAEYYKRSDQRNDA